MHGFNNTYEFDLAFPLIKDAKAGASGEGVFGEISITGFDLGVTLDEKSTVPAFDAMDYTVTAKLNINDLYFTVYDKPSFAFNQAAYIKPYSIDDYDDNDSGAFGAATKSLVRPSITIKGGTSIGYKLADLGSVELRVASLGDWGATAAGTDSYEVVIHTGADILEADAIEAEYINLGTMLPWEAGDGDIAIGDAYVIFTEGAAASANDMYVFGFNTTLTPIEMLTLTFGALYNADNKYLGLTARASAKPMAGLTVVAAMDATKVDTADMLMDIFGSVAYAFNDAKNTFSVETYFANKNATTSGEPRMDLAAKFADKEGLIPGLTLDLAVFAVDLLIDPAFDPMKLAIAEKLSYKVALDGDDYLRPYQAFATDLNGEKTYFRIGVDAALVTNTLFTLDYTAGSILDDVLGNGFVSNAAGTEIAKGVFKFTTKISF